jgi:hypothetical protein
MLFKFNSESKSSNGGNFNNCGNCVYQIDCQSSKSRANRQIEDDPCPFMELESEEDDYESIDGDIYWLDMSDYRYTDTLWDYVEEVDYDQDENDFYLTFMTGEEEEFYKYKYYAMKYLYPKNQNDVKGDIENE